MFVGWTQHGIPWRSATRLIVLTGVAFCFPVITKRNVYCTHLCAFGAAQQLVRNRVPFQFHLKRRIHTMLSLIPPALLLWVVVVAQFDLSFSLVDIEPFDAFLFRISGWAAIVIFG